MSARKKRTTAKEVDAVFCEGSSVEVTSEEDGYAGSWFEAQVMTQLPSPATPCRKRKKGVTFKVQYKTLVEENRSDPLTEHVEYCQLRPLPPVVKEPIGLHDVVDAFVNDGWWEGVVVKVLEESKRFSVLFESPSVHVLDFDSDALRHHLDWVCGYWIRTPKMKNISYVQDDHSQKELATSPDSVTFVEECFPGGSPIYPKYAAKDLSYFQKETEDSSQGNEMAPMKATSSDLASSSESGIVSSQPCKKLKADGIYTLSSCIKLPCQMPPSEIFRAAQLGDIFQSASDVQQSRPTTCLMTANQLSGNEVISAEKDYGTAQQPTNGDIHLGNERTTKFSSWETYCPQGAQNAFRVKVLEATRRDSVMKDMKMEILSLTSSSSDPNPPSLSITELDQPDIMSDPGSLERRDEMEGTSVEIEMQAQTRKSQRITDPVKTDCHRLPFADFVALPDNLRVSDGKREKQLATSSECFNTVELLFPNRSSTFATNVGHENSFLKELEDSHKRNEMAPQMALSTCTDLSCVSKTDFKLPQDVKKGISGSIYTPFFCTKPPFVVLQSETTRALLDEIFQNPSELQHRPASCLMISDQPSRNEDVSCEQSDETVKKPNPAVICGKGKATHLLSWGKSSQKVLPSPQNSFRGDALEASHKGCLMKDTQMGIMNVASTPSNSNCLDVTFNSWILQSGDETTGTPVDTDSQTLPFAKRSPLWRHIESMEAFHTYPQNPHFRPLKQIVESCREGLAIGCMVVFANTVEEMSDLVPDVPKSKINDIMRSVIPLESHGFNVDAMKSCLTLLQEVREGRERLLLASNEGGSKIVEQNRLTMETSAELENALNELNELEEKVAKLCSTKEKQDSEIVALKSKAESIQEGILQNDIHFGYLLPASCLPTQQQPEVPSAV